MRAVGTVGPRAARDPRPAPLVQPLTSVGLRDLATAGGKGANLGALLAAGFAVPPGFVVTTTAYADALAGLSGDPAGLRSAGLDPELVTAVTTAYETLGSPPVAVRSSATTEDLATAAFAGQHDTVLNVVGTAALLDAIRACWASLWSPHAVDYRTRSGLDSQNVAMAVVVQAMVPARSAGVAFTADPVSGRRDRVVVDATRGLGEALVSGQVTPDHYVLSRRGGRVVEARRGREEVVLHGAAGGGITESHDVAGGRVLSRRQLRRLVRTAAAVERAMGGPQDIEWAYADGRLWLLQARPMTAVPDVQAKPSRAERLGATMLAELMPLRPYPIDATLWVPGLLRAVDDFMSELGVRLGGADRMFVERDGVVVGLRPVAARVSPLTPARVLASALTGVTYTRDRLLDDPPVRRVLEAVNRFRRLDLSAVDDVTLAAALRSGLAVAPVVLHARRTFLGRSVATVARLALLLLLLGRVRLLAPLLSGAETMTGLANAELRRLAARGDRTPADVRGFLDRHGHRETALLLVSQPCWADDPAAVEALLAAEANPGLDLASGPARAWAELERHPLIRVPILRRAVRRVVDAAQPALQFREDTHYFATYGMPVVRRALLEYGRRLRLETPEDVFHLRADELEPPTAGRAADLRATVARRRAAREDLADHPLLPKPAPVPTGEGLLRGSAGSAGVATGPVRLVRSPAEFGALRPGEVLVAPYTNPSWTPLFALAAAVVVDAGSVGSHAAIVAREYGIPAVLGVGRGTTLLADGQVVTVDGTRGLVSAGQAAGSQTAQVKSRA